MVYGKQQKKEIETIRERTFKLQLSDADVRRLFEKAEEAGMSVSELLQNFIWDLVTAQQTAQAAQALHAGTIQQQLEAGDQLQEETTEPEQPRRWWQFWK